jgi:protein ImuB
MNAPFMKEGLTAASQRVLALWFPHLPADRILRQRLGRSWRSGEAQRQRRKNPPLVISHRENNAQRIAALDEQAEALRLKPGMGIADARAMHPGIEIIEADPAADRKLLESLADWCDRYTPLVAMEGADGLFLDITGCSHLFGGEGPMLADILTRLFHQGFDARAALASTPGAAWAAARFLNSAILAPGEEADALTPLPLAALRLDPNIRASLESVGLRSAGTIMSAPRAPLARRFGKALLLRLDQALGRVEEAISPRLPVPPLSVERQLVEPIVLTEHIETLTLMLGRILKADLERRGEGAKTLQLLLFRVDGMVSRATVGTSRPLRDPLVIQKLFHERLAALQQDIDVGYGFDLVRLSALEVAPFEMSQTDLSGEADGIEDDLALFADRIRARLGAQAVMKPVLVESHIPERSVLSVPFADMPPRQASSIQAKATAAVPPAQPRPIRLLRHPEPIEASAEVPEGPPFLFRWRRALHRVSKAEGPERISSEWWRDKDVSTRDYFRVEDDGGRRYWLYREGLYGATEDPPRWFMHGIFA